MAIDIKSIGLGAIVGSVVAGVLCWQIAFYRGHHKGGETERANAKEVVAGLLKELDYAKGQIDKVNSAHSAQIEALAANFLAEGEARLAAQKSMEVAVRATSQTATSQEPYWVKITLADSWASTKWAAASQTAAARVPYQVIMPLADSWDSMSVTVRTVTVQEP